MPAKRPAPAGARSLHRQGPGELPRRQPCAGPRALIHAADGRHIAIISPVGEPTCCAPTGAPRVGSNPNQPAPGMKISVHACEACPPITSSMLIRARLRVAEQISRHIPPRKPDILSSRAEYARNPGTRQRPFPACHKWRSAHGSRLFRSETFVYYPHGGGGKACACSVAFAFGFP